MRTDEGSRARRTEPLRRGPRRWRPLGLLRTAAVAAVVVAAAGAATVAIVALGLRQDLADGRHALELGRRAFLDGRISAAADAFEDAGGAFDAAEAEATSWPARVGRVFPVLGRTLDVADALAVAGGHAADAALAISAEIEGLPGGVEALAPADGALPVEALASLAGALEEARSEAGRAVETIRSSPEGLLPGPVADARREALVRLGDVERLLRPAPALARGLPAFGGADGPRRYLFIAENPAELRGTGGIWGAYSIVRADRGRFRFSSFRPIQALPNVAPDAVPAPNPDYRRNYDQYGGAGFWLNMNMTPDYPSAARAALSTWEAIGGDPLDGVITADPFALRDLLAVTGTARVARPPLDVDEGNVVPLLANRAFTRFPDARTRKAVLGDVARAVFDRFLSLGGHAVPKLRAIGRAVGEGHLQIYTTDAEMQTALTGAGLDGGLRATGGDLLAVVVNSASGGKLDFFARRSIDHEVTLVQRGASTAVTVTRIENDAPTSGQPRYVIGPYLGEAGDNIPLLSVFCGPRCRLIRADRNGDRVSLFTGSELGSRFYQDYFTIPSGDTGTLVVRTETRGSWSGDDHAGSYRLTILGQTTIQPTRATVRIAPPAGMRFTAWSRGVSVEGGVATWTGVLQDRLALEVSFESASLPVRLWRALTDLF